jgi:hypothetical protein
MRKLLAKRVTWVVLAAVGVVLAAGLAWFEPWRAFTSSHLDEPAPAAETLAEGTFVSQEHETTGTARVLELPDGSLTLRLEGFATSDGPDVHIWLSDAAADGDWGSYDDGRFVQLGELKATDGNHNYAIPTADLIGMRSVVVWCDRFNVAFGSAPLELQSP